MMQPWFSEAKLGIFLHWGIYSVKGIPESWSFFKEQISYEDYLGQLAGFTASGYDPMRWAELFRRAGACYAVLTAKHHDGVALWDTAASDLSIPKRSPAGGDLIAPYCDALRAAGLKVGLYFSHLDWSHPDYAPLPARERTSRTLGDAVWEKDGGPSAERWRRFLAFHRAQLTELCTRYGDIDLLWFDGDWAPSSNAYWKMGELSTLLHRLQPNVVLNDRMRGHGDYLTPEQGMPVARPEGPWELCVTVNNSWGYQAHDHDHKSVRTLVRMFAECIGMGGNVLLAIGPTEDGSILPEQAERLEGLGDWIGKHEEAVYPSTAGLPHGHFYGASTLSRDRRLLYLIIFDRPWESIAVKGIRNGIERVSVVGADAELAHRVVGGAPWARVPGVLWIDIPEELLDPRATVVKVELDGPLDLYAGTGRAIESN